MNYCAGKEVSKQAINVARRLKVLPIVIQLFMELRASLGIGNKVENLIANDYKAMLDSERMIIPPTSDWAFEADNAFTITELSSAAKGPAFDFTPNTATFSSKANPIIVGTKQINSKSLTLISLLSEVKEEIKKLKLTEDPYDILYKAFVDDDIANNKGKKVKAMLEAAKGKTIVYKPTNATLEKLKQLELSNPAKSLSTIINNYYKATKVGNIEYNVIGEDVTTTDGKVVSKSNPEYNNVIVAHANKFKYGTTVTVQGVNYFVLDSGKVFIKEGDTFKLISVNPELKYWLTARAKEALGRTSRIIYLSLEPKQAEDKNKALEYSRQLGIDNPDVLFLFTDNTDRNSGSNPIDSNSTYAKLFGALVHFPNKTQAVMRGLENALPITTLKHYNYLTGETFEKGRWGVKISEDGQSVEAIDDLEEFKSVIDLDFQRIKEAWDSGKYKYIVIPQILNGDISDISKEGPRAEYYNYLNIKLNALIDYILATATTPNIDISTRKVAVPTVLSKELPDIYTTRILRLFGADRAASRGRAVARAVLWTLEKLCDDYHILKLLEERQKLLDKRAKLKLTKGEKAYLKSLKANINARKSKNYAKVLLLMTLTENGVKLDSLQSLTRLILAHFNPSSLTANTIPDKFKKLANRYEFARAALVKRMKNQPLTATQRRALELFNIDTNIVGEEAKKEHKRIQQEYDKFLEDTGIKAMYLEMTESMADLLRYSQPYIEAICKIRMNIGETKTQSSIIDLADMSQLLDEEETDDNEEKDGGERLTNNYRDIDVESSVSARVTAVLNSTPSLEVTKNSEEAVPEFTYNGVMYKYTYDDMGNIVNNDGSTIHRILLQEMQLVIEPSDFAIYNPETQQYEFVLLNNLVSRYPYLRSIISRLEKDSSLVPLFWRDLRRDWTRMQINDFSKANPFDMNIQSKEDVYYNDLYTRFEDGSIPSTTIWNVSDEENHKRRIAKLKSLVNYSSLLNKVFKDNAAWDLAIKNKGKLLKPVLKDIANLLGITTSDSIIEAIIQDYDAKHLDYYSAKQSDLRVLVTQVLKIANNIDAPSSNAHKVKGSKLPLVGNSFKKGIISILAVPDNRMQSATIRQDGKMYNSMSTPSYFSTIVRNISITSRERALNYLEREFGKYANFRNLETGEWWNPIIGLFTNDKIGDYARGIFERNTTSIITDSDGNNIEYADWSPGDIVTMAVKQFFSGSALGDANEEGLTAEEKQLFKECKTAQYLMPIYADAACSENFVFIKYNKEKDLYKQRLLPMYLLMIRGEIARINLFKAKDKAKKENISIANLDAKGLLFVYFPELNDYRLVVVLGDESTLEMSLLDAYNYYIRNHEEEAATLMLAAAITDALTKESQKFFTLWGETINHNILYTRQGMSSIDATDAEYFTWHNNIMLASIIQMTVGDLAQYSDPVEFQKRFKELYASGLKMFTELPDDLNPSKKINPVFKTIHVKDTIRASYTFDLYYKNPNLSEERRQRIAKKMIEVTGTDGLGIRSLKSFKKILRASALWDETHEEALLHMISGNYSEEDFDLIWNIIKPYFFGADERGVDINIPDPNNPNAMKSVPYKVYIQLKNAEYLLLTMYDLVEGKFSRAYSHKYAKLNEWMEANDIDSMQFESTTKTGAYAVIDIEHDELRVLDEIKDLINNKGKLNGKIALYRDSADLSKLIKELQEILENLDTESFIVEILGLRGLLEGRLTLDLYEKILDKMSLSDQEMTDKLDNILRSDKAKYVIKEERMENYVIQGATPAHFMDASATFSSQGRNIITTNLPYLDASGNIVQYKLHGKNYDAILLKKLYEKLVSENLLQAFDRLRKEFGTIESVLEMLISEINRNNSYDKDLVNALTIVLDERGNKAFNIPAWTPTIDTKISQLVHSIFKNRITKQKINGGTCIRVSSCIVDNRSPKDGGLKMEQKADGTYVVEALFPCWAKALIENYTGDGGKIKFKELLDKHPELLELVGLRIPCEAKYSILNIKCVGFLPQNSQGIMLPHDITQLVGDDFDVDKLFMYLKAFDKQSLGEKKLDLDNFEKGIDLGDKDSRDNAIIDIFKCVLSNPAVTEQQLNFNNFDTISDEASITAFLNNKEYLEGYAIEALNIDKNLPLEEKDTIIKQAIESGVLLSKLRLDKNLGKKLKKAEAKSVKSTSLLAMVKFHALNMLSKKMVGIWANIQAAYLRVLSWHGDRGPNSNVVANDLRILGGPLKIFNKQYESLGRLKDTNGRWISENIAEFLAASVDNAKNPLLNRIRQDPTTAPIMGFLLRMGMPINEAVALLNHPAAVKAIAEYRAESRSRARHLQTLSSNAVANLTVGSLLEDMLRATYGMEINKQREDAIYNLMVDVIIPSSDDLNSMSLALRADSPNGAADPKVSGNIARLLNLKKLLGKFGKTVIEKGQLLNIFPDNDFRLLAPLNRDGSIVPLLDDELDLKNDSIETIRENLHKNPLTMHNAFLLLGINSVPSIASDIFYQYSSEFISMVEQFYQDYRQDSDRYTQATVGTLARDFVMFCATSTNLLGADPNMTLEGKRAWYIQEFPQFFRAFKYAKGNEDLVNNQFLKNLLPKYNEQYHRYELLYKDLGKLNSLERTFIKLALLSFFYNDNEKIKHFAQMTAIYSYFNDGMLFTPNGYGPLFSSEILSTLSGFLEAMRTVPTHLSEDNIDKFLEQTIKNNEALVPTFKPDKNGTLVRVENNKVLINTNKVVKTRALKDIYEEGNLLPFIRVNNNLYQLLKSGDSTEFSEYVLVDWYITNGVKRYDMLSESVQDTYITDLPKSVADDTEYEYEGQMYTNRKEKEKQDYYNDLKPNDSNLLPAVTKEEQPALSDPEPSLTPDSPVSQAMQNKANDIMAKKKAIDAELAKRGIKGIQWSLRLATLSEDKLQEAYELLDKGISINKICGV